MLHPHIIHPECHLNNQPLPPGFLKHLGKHGIFQAIAVVVGREPNPRHVIVLAATVQVFVPVRQQGIDASEGQEQIPVPTPALFYQSGIGPAHVAMK
jgi:hypothetical protein